MFKTMKALLAGAALLAVSVQTYAMKVATVNYPLAYFAERIGGEHIDVLFTAPVDEDPAFWEPSEAEVAQYQSADLVLLNGADYAKWVSGATLKHSKLVDTGKAYKDNLIHIEEADHDHGYDHGDDDHSHAGTAFTTWIDFQQAQQQVDAITKVLSRKKRSKAKLFEANAETLKKDLAVLDQSMQQLGEQLKGQSFVASHPVYKYMARRYQIAVNELMWEPEMTIGESELADLKKAVEATGAQWMIWEGEPSAENSQKMIEQGLKNMVYSPSGNRPEKGDWLAQMKANIEQLKQAIN